MDFTTSFGLDFLPRGLIFINREVSTENRSTPAPGIFMLGERACRHFEFVDENQGFRGYFVEAAKTIERAGERLHGSQ
ncbi:hypothetical protein [Pseudomonas chlororaphis]|uniref:hypothetical protein n=1 Tax=Pseudomonas chlororaphis TaxID=587753 RepID=UPI0023655BC0|nr:hypothetical protein [Pseudomonas chlororaphis]WDH19860.1 hypothetical protein PUP50_17600 [Pseudomonas chlororaphis]